jgi:2-polyprenyl-3-methyl-5-hydroxy-6-metoxy-1,4-benzoquinol methylase
VGDNGDSKLAELAAIVQEIRERVRERHPASAGSIALPDLTAVVHARDAAQAKVAAIGTVNPRPPGFANSVVQGVKRLVARALDWHVREQVEFNRAAVASIETLLQALDDSNRAHAELAARLAAAEREAAATKDMRSHWEQWRREWEQKLATNEVQFLRSVADLQAAFQHRATLMESNYRDLVRSQHDDFTGALDRATLDIQKRLWADLERIRAEYERLIHAELRVIRQRAAAVRPAAVAASGTAAPTQAPEIDWLRFADRFRGSEDHVRRSLDVHVPRFKTISGEVLDLGCGRGEFLERMRQEGVAARGVDLSEESVAICRGKKLDVVRADLFEHLAGLADASLAGIFCAQVVEHLPPERLPELVRLAHSKLSRDGVIVIETPNPECLAIFATHFFIDPTHTRPIPPALLVFYLEEAGFGLIEVERLSPAIDSMPELAPLPLEFREQFFGGLDYAVSARKLG